MQEMDPSDDRRETDQANNIPNPLLERFPGIPKARELFGDKVKELRQKGGRNLRQFTREEGMDPARHSQIERGHALPRGRSDLDNLGQALGVSPREGHNPDYSDFVRRATEASEHLPSDVPPELETEHAISQIPKIFRNGGSS